MPTFYRPYPYLVFVARFPCYSSLSMSSNGDFWIVFNSLPDTFESIEPVGNSYMQQAINSFYLVILVSLNVTMMFLFFQFYTECTVGALLSCGFPSQKQDCYKPFQLVLCTISNITFKILNLDGMTRTISRGKV